MDKQWLITMAVSILLIVAFLYFGLQLADCSGRVNKMKADCEEACMCPWEMNLPLGNFTDVFEWKAASPPS